MDTPSTSERSLKVRLLEAALDSIRGLDASTLLNAVGVREIARRAGGSPTSIYHHYGSLEGLAAAVLDHVYNPAIAPVDGILRLIENVQDSQLPLNTALDLHGQELDRNSNDPDYPLRVGLWAFGGAPATEKYRHYLRTIDDQLAAVALKLFESWARVLREPFTIENYMAIRVALLNGSTLRHQIEPDALPRGHYQRAAVALDVLLLKVLTDSQDTDSRLAEMNYYPIAPVAPNIPDTERARTTNARILNSTANLFTALGFEGTTFEHVAAHANASISTLKRYYPSKQHLALALFQQQVHDELLDQDVPGEPAAGSRPGLVEHLSVLAAFTPPRTAQASAYLTHVLTTESYTDALVDRTHTLLAKHSVRQDTSGPIDPYDTSRLLVALTIRNALHHPTAPPALNAETTLDSLGLG